MKQVFKFCLPRRREDTKSLYSLELLDFCGKKKFTNDGVNRTCYGMSLRVTVLMYYTHFQIFKSNYCHFNTQTFQRLHCMFRNMVVGNYMVYIFQSADLSKTSFPKFA